MLGHLEKFLETLEYKNVHLKIVGNKIKFENQTNYERLQTMAPLFNQTV
jgi:hypothetical protein